MFSRFLGRAKGKDQATEALYRRLVSQARQPVFYRTFAVPDTVEGRLEMIFLHLVLLFHRLHRDGEAGQEVTQAVFDQFTADMDRSLREMGVGDLSVPKRMKAIGQSFYGRLEVYGRALAEEDRAALSRALDRNLRPDGPADDRFGQLSAYAFDAASTLHGASIGDIIGGEFAFPGLDANADQAAAR